MKTSTRISFAAVTAALAVVALCFSACPSNKGVQKDDAAAWKFNLKVHGTSTSETYLLVDKRKFDEALCDLDKDDPNTKKKKGFYDIEFKATANASPILHYHPTCTPSGVADSSAAGASAANDPNATQHVRVNRPQDLEAVLAAFAEPSPTP